MYDGPNSPHRRCRTKQVTHPLSGKLSCAQNRQSRPCISKAFARGWMLSALGLALLLGSAEHQNHSRNHTMVWIEQRLTSGSYGTYRSGLIKGTTTAANVSVASLTQNIGPSEPSAGWIVYVASGHKSLYAKTTQLVSSRVIRCTSAAFERGFSTVYNARTTE